MKVKKRNLLELTLQGIILLLAVIPGFCTFEDWIDDVEYLPSVGMYIPIQTLRDRSTYSLFNALFDTDTIIMVVGMILFAAFIGAVVVYALQYAAKGAKRNWLIPVILSCVELVLLVSISILIEVGDRAYSDWEYKYSLQPIAYVTLFITVALVVITILGYKKAATKGIEEETPKIYRTEVVNNIASADELKKYKELLDSGVISQEEFDAKKKQLLGL